ncbi:hypothetical protein OOU_Y34scaffold00733g7 [Pyricularia oryzae Y34]|uniref:Uncharacterized protein n=1 Tax=Pyricularia oryzae (strain Y34) TaxID=1143189 RepID=A0AA97NRS6_PYRO3|nr:hypothetical protein OOU_Y34scaffold00733g7 [Pyricularia oryzae Y34]
MARAVRPGFKGYLRKGRPAPEISDTQAPSPEENASFWSRLVFAWPIPLLAVGFCRPLECNDISLIPESRSADKTVQKVVHEFRNGVRQKYPLARALYASSKADF